MIALLRRDLHLAVRAGGGFGLGLAFVLILCTLIPFGIGPQSRQLSVVAPGILWVGALLACLLSLDRIFALDAEDGALDLLATAPAPLEGVILAKAAAHWLTTGLPLVLAAPLYGLLLSLPTVTLPWLMLGLVIGTPALSILGAFGASLTVGLRRGGLLLSIIVLPLYIPTLVFGAELARRGAAGQPIGSALALLAGVTFASLALIPFAAAAALRINLR